MVKVSTLTYNLGNFGVWMCSTGWFKKNCFRSQCWPNVGGQSRDIFRGVPVKIKHPVIRQLSYLCFCSLSWKSRIDTANNKFVGSTLRMKNSIALKTLPTHRELLDLIFPAWRPDWKARKDCGWGKRGLAGGGCPNIVISGIEAVPLLLTSNPPWFGGKWESRVEQQCIVGLFVSALLCWNSLCLTHPTKQEAKSLN